MEGGKSNFDLISCIMKNIRLERMTLEDYNNYIAFAIKSYTKELLLSGRFESLQEASDFANWEYNDIFKQGFETENTFMYKIIVNDEKIGIIWFIKENNEGFIGDFFIHEQYRGNKYGYQTLLLLEPIAIEYNIIKLRLGVFKHNIKAQKLYFMAGYSIIKEREKDYTMAKILM